MIMAYSRIRGEHVSCLVCLMALFFGAFVFGDEQGGVGVGAAEVAKAVTVMVVIPEPQGYGDPAAETEVIRQFLRAGYRVLDQQQVAAHCGPVLSSEIRRDPLGPDARAAAKMMGAQVLIAGETIAEHAGSAQGLETARARVNVRALLPDTGEVLASEGVHESGADTTFELALKKALQQAGRRAAERLIPVVGEKTGGPTQLPKEERPLTGVEEALRTGRKLRVAVAPFDDRSGWTGASWNLQELLPDLIAKELMKLGIVDVVDRAGLSDVFAEQRLDLSGLVDRSEEPRELGTLLPADVLVVGRISEFAAKKTSGGAIVPWKGGAGLHLEEGVVSILLKVVDVQTGQILGMGEATGEATEAVVAGGYVGIIFGGAKFDKTAIGRATRKAVTNCVTLISGALARAGLAVKTCQECGAVVPEEARFCPQCGKPVGPPPGEARCEKCGEKLPPAAKFCPHCGAKVH
jgi:curli biogenesis system outer membrane secretion channel CsgG